MQQLSYNHQLLRIAVCAAFSCSIAFGAVVEITDPGTTTSVTQRPPVGIHSYGPGAVTPPGGVSGGEPAPAEFIEMLRGRTAHAQGIQDVTLDVLVPRHS